MKRVKLIVAYDGTAYSGWQIQKNSLSVQEVLNRHLSALLCEEIHTIGASRTDAGVHARGNVAVFDTSARMPADRISYALNTRLPADIRIQDSREVSEDFHPRFCHSIKTYEYAILHRPFPDPTRRLNTLFHYGPLDIERMRRAAAYLLGEHDFRSFATENPQITTTVRTIYTLDITQDDDVIRIHVSGSGFLYHMVRILAGTFIEVGSGARSPEEIPQILAARDRRCAGPTAPAHGLTLLSIKYLPLNTEPSCHKTGEECAG